MGRHVTGVVTHEPDLGAIFLDYYAAAGPEAIGEAIRVLLGSGEIDALLVVFAVTRAGDVEAVRPPSRRRPRTLRCRCW